MNEQELAKKITRHLNDGVSLLGQDTLDQLKSARKAALQRHRVRQPVLGLAWAGHFSPTHGRHGYRFWLPVIALILALAGTLYWQSNQSTGDAGEIDAALLSGDLPIHAYLDQDFGAWLESSSQ